VNSPLNGPPNRPNRVVEPIFQADAAQTDLPTALQLMSGLSRNRFLVQALDAGEQLLGEIEVKGGMVLRAQVGGLQGREAVFALLHLRPQTLSASHVQDGDLGEPLGSLERLLMEGAVVIDELARPNEEPPAPLADLPELDAVETASAVPPQSVAQAPASADARSGRAPSSGWLPLALGAGLLLLISLIFRKRG
jgi:hypothetical protein